MKGGNIMRGAIVLFTLLVNMAGAYASVCPEVVRTEKNLVERSTNGYVPILIELKVNTADSENEKASFASLGKFRFWMLTAETIRYDKYGMLFKAEKCVFPIGPKGLHKLYLTVAGKAEPQDANETVRTFRGAALLPRSIAEARPAVGAHYTLDGGSIPFVGQWSNITFRWIDQVRKKQGKKVFVRNVERSRTVLQLVLRAP